MGRHTKELGGNMWRAECLLVLVGPVPPLSQVLSTHQRTNHMDLVLQPCKLLRNFPLWVSVLVVGYSFGWFQSLNAMITFVGDGMGVRAWSPSWRLVRFSPKPNEQQTGQNSFTIYLIPFFEFLLSSPLSFRGGMNNGDKHVRNIYKIDRSDWQALLLTP